MRVIVADDDREATAALSLALKKYGVEADVAHDSAAVGQLLRSGEPVSLAIVNGEMPGLEGADFCRQLRSQPSWAAPHIILLTRGPSGGDSGAGFDAAADDHLSKPIHPEELRARVSIGMRVASLQAHLAERVAELQVARDDLARLTSTDVLTNLYARHSWLELAHMELTRSRRYGRPLSVMVIDLDGFKRVNDTHGHCAGDHALRQFADMLRVVCRSSDVIGRLGGEEFAVLVPETPLDAAQILAGRITGACRSLVVRSLSGQIACSCSLGLIEAGPGDEDIEVVLRRADLALCDAKRNGRDRWKSYGLAPDEDRSQLALELA